ncbi:probable N-acetyltransferase HLS1-like [Phoenix dactylifera]|uniref:Probable N-acetyltransferase HLS1-like n=1 Tax=Phoenix dactylifera TaxID=42345 RepID=A0A8B8ZFX4_PHODC|nr:probable N-acetyltransferase HLS1-like [Phoenix dactylifera]
MIRVREFNMEKDSRAVEEMEKRCEVGPSATSATDGGKKKNKKKKTTSLYVDLLGDPICRVRHTPDHVMLVAEYGEKKEMVGVIRACVKMVSRGRESSSQLPAYVKVAYVLGLRVSPSHRRLGIGRKLVERVEAWCLARGAEYAYMATDGSNTASLNLFAGLSYARFRSPAVLVHPVHAHHLPPSSSATLVRLPPSVAAALYARFLPPSSTEFLPSDLPSLLSHPFTLGSFLALPSSSSPPSFYSLSHALPESFALLSLWDCTRVFRLRVSGAPAAARAALALLRSLDERVPWMRLPSVRDFFRPFGVYFMYGLRMAGPEGPRLLRALCRLAHNLAVADETCAAVVAEVGRHDPVRAAVPHWRRFSWDEDVWCMKRLKADTKDDNWIASPPSTDVIFVDPRDF